MSKSPRHPFLTFVFSGLVATVLIGGAIASFEVMQQNQDTTTRAYMGAIPLRSPNPGKFVCGATCKTDSECGAGGYCLTAKKNMCPPGKMCAQVVVAGVCRLAACKDDMKCSCAGSPVATVKPMRQAY